MKNIVIEIPQHVLELMEKAAEKPYRDYKPEAILTVWLQQNAATIAGHFVDKEYHGCYNIRNTEVTSSWDVNIVPVV